MEVVPRRGQVSRATVGQVERLGDRPEPRRAGLVDARDLSGRAGAAPRASPRPRARSAPREPRGKRPCGRRRRASARHRGVGRGGRWPGARPRSRSGRPLIGNAGHANAGPTGREEPEACRGGLRAGPRNGQRQAWKSPSFSIRSTVNGHRRNDRGQAGLWAGDADIPQDGREQGSPGEEAKALRTRIGRWRNGPQDRVLDLLDPSAMIGANPSRSRPTRFARGSIILAIRAFRSRPVSRAIGSLPECDRPGKFQIPRLGADSSDRPIDRRSGSSPRISGE